MNNCGVPSARMKYIGRADTIFIKQKNPLLTDNVI